MNVERFRFTVRALLLAMTLVAVGTAFAVGYPEIAVLILFFVVFVALHFLEAFLRYFPKATLIGCGGVSALFLGSAGYAFVRDRVVNQSVYGKLLMGLLFLLTTGLIYVSLRQRKS